MPIIFEGVNKTGKSAAIKILEDVYGFKRFYDRSIYERYSSNNQLLKTAMHTMSLSQAMLFPYLPKDLVFDRFHLTEFAYGTLRGYPVASNFEDVEKELIKHNTYLVLMDDDISKINERANKDLTREYILMNNAYDRSKLPKIKVNLMDIFMIDKIFNLVKPCKRRRCIYE